MCNKGVKEAISRKKEAHKAISRKKEAHKAISRKKEAHKAMYRNSMVENRNRQKSMNNKAKKFVLKAIRDKTEETLTEFKNCPNGMFRQVKGLNIDRKKVDG